jgi:hypothetical protein
MTLDSCTLHLLARHQSIVNHVPSLRLLIATTLLAYLLTIAVGTAAHGEVVINEIFYHAPDDLEKLEYIELLNTGKESVDISGWSLAKAVKFTFKQGTTIAGGEFIVVAKDAELLDEFYKVAALGEYKKSLSNSGDEVQLLDRDGKIVESVRYTDSAPWPESADAGSASLERICPTAPGDDPSNWAPSLLSSDYDKLPSGTPGKANSVVADALPPAIESVTWSPAQPKPGAKLTVTVQPARRADITKAALYYRIVAPGAIGEEQTVALVGAGKGKFTAQIATGKESNRLLRFRVVAEGENGGVAYVPAKNEFRPAYTVFVNDAVEADKIPVVQFFHAEKSAFEAGEKYRDEQARPPTLGGFFGGFGPPPGGRPENRPAPGERRPDQPRPDQPRPGEGPRDQPRGPNPRGDRPPGGPGPGGPGGFPFGFFGGFPPTPLLPQGPSAVVYTDPKTGQSDVFDFVNIVRRKSGWKVRFHKDQPLLAMTTVNFLYEPDEATILNESLAYELYRLAGNASYLSGYMRLVVNGQPVGYHLYFEQPNGSFFRRNKIDDGGDLYKLIWMGNAEMSQRLPHKQIPTRRDIAGRYEKKTHRHEGYQDLIALIERLERSKSDAETWEIIEQNFEVDQVVNYFAVNSLLAHWDGFFNNFFFYYDRDGSGKWSMFPWDQDSTWSLRGGAPAELHRMPIYFGAQGARPGGLDRTARPAGPQPGFFFGGGFGGPGWWRDGGDISRPLLANPEFYKRFQKKLSELTDTVFTEGTFGPRIDQLFVTLEPEVRLRATLRQSDEVAAAAKLKQTLARLREHLVERRAFVRKEVEQVE